MSIILTGSTHEMRSQNIHSKNNVCVMDPVSYKNIFYHVSVCSILSLQYCYPFLVIVCKSEKGWEQKNGVSTL